MPRFTFSKLSKMGDFDEKYGQAYWGSPNEQLVPVKFNSMNPNITQEDAIEAEEVLLKKSSKGTEYHQLKKVKVVNRLQEVGRVQQAPVLEAVGAPTAPRPTSDSEILERLKRIEEKLDTLIGPVEEEEPKW